VTSPVLNWRKQQLLKKLSSGNTSKRPSGNGVQNGVSGNSGNNTLPVKLPQQFVDVRMIEDARVLQPEFVPRDVIHRDHEVQYLSSVLEPILNGDPAEPVFLHGPSGSGKTCIARFTVDRLRQNVVELTTQYVNCWRHYNRFKTLHKLLEGIDQAFDIHRQSTPRDVLVDRLDEYTGGPYVVVLDEVDQLEDKDVLYDLYRIPAITMILIANNEDEVFAEFDERIRSRLTAATSIEFQPYSTNELTGILGDRVKWGLEPGVITDDQLHRIADAAAGDARTAIGVLRNAAKQARSNGLDIITDEVISEAIPEATREIRQTDLDRLIPDQRLLYDLIVDAEEISPGDLYDRYQEEADDPKSRRMVRSYLSKMEHYNLIEADGATRGRIYRPTTPTRLQNDPSI
jgi:orc1/cdc6 family replication initiation protein